MYKLKYKTLNGSNLKYVYSIIINWKKIQTQ